MQLDANDLFNRNKRELPKHNCQSSVFKINFILKFGFTSSGALENHYLKAQNKNLP